MIVSSISFAVSKQFEKHSMDVKHLAAKGDVFTTDKDKNILSAIDILTVIDTESETLKPTQKTEDIVDLLSRTQQSVFAVTDDRNRLLGIVDFNKSRDVVFSSFRVKYTTLAELMTVPQEVATLEDALETIMERFETAGTDYLPVLKNDRFYGFIYKAKVLEAYRNKLREMIIE
jgi:CIC family chloride channel protein